MKNFIKELKSAILLRLLIAINTEEIFEITCKKHYTKCPMYKYKKCIEDCDD